MLINMWLLFIMCYHISITFQRGLIFFLSTLDNVNKKNGDMEIHGAKKQRGGNGCLP